MKSIKTFATVLALTTLSFGSFAAEKIATVSVGDVSTLDAFEAQVAAKAQAAGASSYRIVSVIGDDHLRGTAVLYK